MKRKSRQIRYPNYNIAKTKDKNFEVCTSTLPAETISCVKLSSGFSFSVKNMGFWSFIKHTLISVRTNNSLCCTIKGLEGHHFSIFMFMFLREVDKRLLKIPLTKLSSTANHQLCGESPPSNYDLLIYIISTVSLFFVLIYPLRYGTQLSQLLFFFQVEWILPFIFTLVYHTYLFRSGE